MGVFDLKAPPASAIAEIQRRVGEGGIKFAGKRYPWIRITAESGGKLDSANYPEYEASSKRPGKPIATGVDVKKQGELGTTRRATVKFICFTDNQLAEIAPGFFNPGASMAVEWGWSVGGGGGSAGAPSNANFGSDINASNAMRAASAGNPNYDGLQGKIANFNYSLTADNTWDCQVEIIAVAETIVAGPAATYGCAQKCAMEYPSSVNPDETTKTAKSTLYTMLKQIFEDFDSAAGYMGNLAGDCALNGVPCTIAEGHYNGAQRTESGQDDTSIWEKIIPFNDPDATEAYISYGTLEAAINRYCIPGGNNKVYAAGRLATGKGGMLLKSYPTMESSDPRVCILPGSPYASQIVDGIVAPSCFEGNGINLSNILLNNVFLMTQLDQVEQQENPKISDFLKGVLNKVNDVCGGLWGFEIVSADSENDKYPTVSVVDIKAGATQSGNVAITMIPTTPSNSIVREFKLALKLTDSMKSQAMYAKTGAPMAKSPSGGNCDAKAIASIGSLPPPKQATTPCDCSSAGKTSKPQTFSQAFEELKKKVTDDTVNAARTVMLEGMLTPKDNNICKSMPLPFEFSLTLDGIGGFGFGQVISSDRIPPNIRNQWYFQVTAVEHSVTAQDWTTTINTVARFRNN